MDSDIQQTRDAIRHCAQCPVCRYTRNSKKKNIIYYFFRFLEKICPNCRLVNRKMKKDFQKSGHFEE